MHTNGSNRHHATTNTSNTTINDTTKENDTMNQTTTINATSTAPSAPIVAPSPSPSPSPSASLPTEEDVGKMLDLLDAFRLLLGSWATPMTTKERTRSLRFRRGGEPTAALVAGLGMQYGVQIPGIDPQSIQRHALLVQRLQPLETKLRVITGLVADTVGNAKAEAWQGTTALYTALVRASRRDPALQQELKPAVTFFKPKAAPAVAKAEPKKDSSAAGAPPTEPDGSAAAPAPQAQHGNVPEATK